MKLLDILCPPLADLRRTRNTVYQLKEQLRELSRRVEALHEHAKIHDRSGILPRKNFLALAARHPRILADIRPGALCVDCGAHAGTVAEVLLRLGAEVHAVEPHPVLAAYLRYRLHEFAAAGRLTVHAAAAHTADGQVTLQILEPLEKTSLGDGLSESSTTAPEKQAAQNTAAAAPQAAETAPANGTATEKNSSAKAAAQPETLTVPALDLARFLQGLGRRVTLLKLDIEGAEYDVLTHLITTGAHALCDHILVETHHGKIPALQPKAEALHQLIASRGLTHIHLDWV